MLMFMQSFSWLLLHSMVSDTYKLAVHTFAIQSLKPVAMSE